MEGQQTEDRYLTHWGRLYREHVAIKIDPFHGGPAQLVERALAFKRSEQVEERKGRGASVDEIWCVFDVDEHPGIAMAMAEARRGGIEVIVSDPCLEIWFVWHHQDHTAHLHRDAAQRISQSLLQCDKSLTPTALDTLRLNYSDAKRRAEAMDREHEANGLPPVSNPSSGMWTLIERIRLASQ